MKRVVQYIAIDPYYSDITHTYIGSSSEEIDNIQYETEEFMRGEHTHLGMIYKAQIIQDEYENNNRYQE